MTDPRLDAFHVDVRDLLERSVANLYSHLVTRPTGRAVRLAIESQIEELGRPVVSLVDLSSVAILDYSCADEVVAKLLLGRRGEVFYLFRGLGEHHREPVVEVLARHRLAAVVQPRGRDVFELLGARTDKESEVWRTIEGAGRVPAAETERVLGGAAEREVAEGLVARGLLFQNPLRGDLHALSTLLAPGGGG